MGLLIKAFEKGQISHSQLISLLGVYIELKFKNSNPARKPLTEGN